MAEFPNSIMQSQRNTITTPRAGNSLPFRIRTSVAITDPARMPPWNPAKMPSRIPVATDHAMTRPTGNNVRGLHRFQRHWLRRCVCLWNLYVHEVRFGQRRSRWSKYSRNWLDHPGRTHAIIPKRPSIDQRLVEARIPPARKMRCMTHQIMAPVTVERARGVCRSRLPEGTLGTERSVAA